MIPFRWIFFFKHFVAIFACSWTERRSYWFNQNCLHSMWWFQRENSITGYFASAAIKWHTTGKLKTFLVESRLKIAKGGDWSKCRQPKLTWNTISTTFCVHLQLMNHLAWHTLVSFIKVMLLGLLLCIFAAFQHQLQQLVTCCIAFFLQLPSLMKNFIYQIDLSFLKELFFFVFFKESFFAFFVVWGEGGNGFGPVLFGI